MTEQKPATITIDNDDLVHLGGSAPAIPTRRSQFTGFLASAAIVAGLVVLAFMQGTR